jgi:hypothetical protein
MAVDMPDRRRHRGPHPQDRQLFADRSHELLSAAADDLSWLRGRGYADDAALKLVGERYRLKQRQRVAVARAACAEEERQRRQARLIGLARCRGTRIGIDGFNLLITIETALSGGLIVIARDGCYRDLATVWGTYRKIDETPAAIAAIYHYLQGAGVHEVDWYLDRPVSNSGRLKSLLAATLPTDNQWRIELVDDPDPVLARYDGPVVSSDSWILDHCRSWSNLAGELIEAAIPQAWKLDLSS